MKADASPKKGTNNNNNNSYIIIKVHNVEKLAKSISKVFTSLR